MTTAAGTATPTSILMSEHRVIERMLVVLDRMADEFLEAGAVNAPLAAEAVDFLRTFADRCHHGKEEVNLFPAMERLGLPREAGPTAVMRQEHTVGRSLTSSLAVAAEKGDVRRFADTARAYTGLLREHILKEDQVLFPMADEMLTPDMQADLLRAFERVEHDDLGPGTHERLLGVVERLCDRFGVPETVPSKVGGCGGGGCGHHRS